MSWANEICAADAEERAIVLGVMNASAYVVNVWLPMWTYPVTEGPRFKRGFRWSVLAAVLEVGITGCIWWVARAKDQRRKRGGRRGRGRGGERPIVNV